MNTIKAIETRYAGYRFRSRLEARWAIFFDALGLEWEYEPEGFETEAGWYLPDFRVMTPNISGREWAWVEVKPQQLNRVEREKAFEVSSYTNAPLVELNQIPRDCWVGLGSTYIGVDMEGSESLWRSEDLIRFAKRNGWVHAGEHGRNALKKALVQDIKYYRDKYGVEHPWNFKNGFVVISIGLFYDLDEQNYAITAARSARFEHGERP